MGRNDHGAALLLIGALLLSSCGGSEASVVEPDDASDQVSMSDSNDSGSENASETVEEARPDFDEDAAKDAAEDEVASETYADIGSPYGCTDDCSGHEAGFRFRADNGYAGDNPDSPSFNEGGQAFDEAVEERVEEKRQAYDSGEDPEE